MTYKTMKVFDCQDGMPQDTKECFFKLYESYGNDCYIRHEVIPATWFDEETNTDMDCDDHTPLDAWLMSQGAQVAEQVLINHWW